MAENASFTGGIPRTCGGSSVTIDFMTGFWDVEGGGSRWEGLIGHNTVPT